MTAFATKRGALAVRTDGERSIGTLCVRWLVSRADGPGALTVTVSDMEASAVQIDASGVAITIAQGGDVRIERVEGLEHVEVSGLLSLTVRRGEEGEAVLLFARTPLLESLGIAGGCIERPVIESV
ncbi:MAG TPA: hypothetical protein VFF65_12370 [Phycisphaerales bacterium]|nr:hypothetical protein [Phycisphaerales bacterium]